MSQKVEPEIIQLEYQGHLLTARVKEIEYSKPEANVYYPGYTVPSNRLPRMVLEILSIKGPIRSQPSQMAGRLPEEH